MYNEANTSYIVTLSLCTRRSTFQPGKRITFSGFPKTVMSAAFVRLTFLTQLTFKNHGRGLNNLVLPLIHQISVKLK